jgi:hypothetical protein
MAWKTSREQRAGCGGRVFLSGLTHFRPPVLYRNRPSFVVAPTAGQLQVPRRESFEPKSTSLNELARSFVIRLNVGLKPMQPLPAKCFRKNSAQTRLIYPRPLGGTKA